MGYCMANRHVCGGRQAGRGLQCYRARGGEEEWKRAGGRKVVMRVDGVWEWEWMCGCGAVRCGAAVQLVKEGRSAGHSRQESPQWRHS